MGFLRLIRTTVALSGLGALLLSPTPGDARCIFEKYADLPVKLDEGGPLVGVTINGKHGWMLFSNRANASTLFKSATDEISLKPYRTYFEIVVNGRPAQAYGVHVDKFQLDGAPTMPADLFVAVSNVPKKLPVWGVASTTLYPGKAIDYDYPEKKIGIYTEDYCSGQSLAYWDSKIKPVQVQRKDLATLSGEINGSTIEVRIASNFPYSTINDAAVKLANATIKTFPKPGAASDPAAERFAVIQTLHIGDETFKNIPIRIENDGGYDSASDIPLGVSRSYDRVNEIPPRVVLGIDYLINHHVLISPNQRLAYISRVANARSEMESTETPPSSDPKRP